MAWSTRPTCSHINATIDTGDTHWPWLWRDLDRSGSSAVVEVRLSLGEAHFSVEAWRQTIGVKIAISNYATLAIQHLLYNTSYTSPPIRHHRRHSRSNAMDIHHANTHVHTEASVHIGSHVSIHMSTYKSPHTHVHTQMSAHTCPHTNFHTHMSTHTCPRMSIDIIHMSTPTSAPTNTSSQSVHLHARIRKHMSIHRSTQRSTHSGPTCPHTRLTNVHICT